MGTHRVYARSPRLKQRRRDKKEKANSWIQKQRCKDATWTSFKFDMQRLRTCYNLPDEVGSAIFREYRQGRPGANNVNMVPRDPNNIRQDVLATFLLFKYNLTLEDFILAKKVATMRNRGRSNPNSEVEVMRWPAMLDIFANCPPTVSNAISDEGLADYFVNEKYKVSSEGGGSESEDVDSLNQSVTNTAEIRDFRRQTSDEESENHESMLLIRPFQSVKRPQSNANVDLLRHAYQTFDSWPSAEWMKRFYGIKHTKLCQVRSEIAALKEGRVDGVTEHDFAMTFSCDEQMEVKLQTNKEKSIQQVLALYNSNYNH